MSSQVVQRDAIHIAKQKIENPKEEIASAIDIFEGVDVEDRKAARHISRSIRSANGLLKQIDRGLSVMLWDIDNS